MASAVAARLLISPAIFVNCTLPIARRFVSNGESSQYRRCPLQSPSCLRPLARPQSLLSLLPPAHLRPRCSIPLSRGDTLMKEAALYGMGFRKKCETWRCAWG
jgi:hypothetical protein